MANNITWDDMKAITDLYGRYYDKISELANSVDDSSTASRYATAAKLYVRGGNDLLTGRGKRDGTLPTVVLPQGTPDYSVIVSDGASGTSYVTTNNVELAITSTAVYDPVGHATSRDLFDGDGVQLNAGEAYGVTIYAYTTNSTTNGGTIASVKGPKATYGNVSFPSPPSSGCVVIAWVIIKHGTTVEIESADIILAPQLAKYTGLQNDDNTMALFTSARSCADAIDNTITEMSSKISGFVNGLSNYILTSTGQDFRSYYYDLGYSFDGGFSKLYHAITSKYTYVKLGTATVGTTLDSTTYVDGDTGKPGTLPGPSDVQAIVSTAFNVATTFTVWYTDDAKKSNIWTPMTAVSTDPVAVTDPDNFSGVSYARIGTEVILYSGLLSGIYLDNITRGQKGTTADVHTAGDDVYPLTSTTLTVASGVAVDTVRTLGISTSDIIDVTSTHAASATAAGAIILRNI